MISILSLAVRVQIGSDVFEMSSEGLVRVWKRSNYFETLKNVEYFVNSISNQKIIS